MTLDEFLHEVDRVSSHEPVTYLSNLLHEWKRDSTTVIELADQMERFFDPVFLDYDKIAYSLHE